MVDKNRRKFLELVFVGTVTTILPPHKLLGFLRPQLKETSDEILGIYGISLNDYPELIPIWGSIRIKIENTLMFYPKVIIVHVPKEDYGVDFIAVSERCPHEGYPVKDLDPDLHLFECSGHGTLFDVTGKYVWGPASRDLERIHLEYDGDKTIYLEVALYPLGKFDEKEQFTFLHQNSPNPCSTSTIVRFGTEKLSYVEIILIDSKGKIINKLFSGFVKPSGEEILIDVSELNSGVYFIKMSVEGKFVSIKKMIVEH
ncbi:T9SS C-terminal target domain-containing protein [Bacteroidetes/Chlorobi group bacterium Naka2016]|nr:MAG: T9SS C-terminal target domain-containing protein [Bacteroidetes/Chlorobi group bacterium Naka2016]